MVGAGQDQCLKCLRISEFSSEFGGFKDLQRLKLFLSSAPIFFFTFFLISGVLRLNFLIFGVLRLYFLNFSNILQKYLTRQRKLTSDCN